MELEVQAASKGITIMPIFSFIVSGLPLGEVFSADPWPQGYIWGDRGSKGLESPGGMFIAGEVVVYVPP